MFFIHHATQCFVVFIVSLYLLRNSFFGFIEAVSVHFFFFIRLCSLWESALFGFASYKINLLATRVGIASMLILQPNSFVTVTVSYGP